MIREQLPSYVYSLSSSTWGSGMRATRSTAQPPRRKPSRFTSRSVPRCRGTSACRLRPWSSTAVSGSSTQTCTNTSSRPTRSLMRLSCTTGPPYCRVRLALCCRQARYKLSKLTHHAQKLMHTCTYIQCHASSLFIINFNHIPVQK